MDIETSHGKVKNASVKPYDKGVYTLGYIRNNGNGSYALVCFEVPSGRKNPVWRFFVKFGYKDGSIEIKETKLNWHNTIKVIRLYDEYHGMCS